NEAEAAGVSSEAGFSHRPLKKLSTCPLAMFTSAAMSMVRPVSPELSACTVAFITLLKETAVVSIMICFWLFIKIGFLYLKH
ncbi:hypothetical protein RSW84_26940, partial [Escherichia coli]|uniref:hypothetical protein n=1 Tax=Escherichia coli TaxID=562 RepID=UPI0028DFF7D7